ncbi:hypothetical protein CB1_000255002 [Camelus ferus]|nr:hypothetical protein CB1_000255002 [Camelus ferus]
MHASPRGAAIVSCLRAGVPAQPLCYSQLPLQDVPDSISLLECIPGGAQKDAARSQPPAEAESGRAHGDTRLLRALLNEEAGPGVCVLAPQLCSPRKSQTQGWTPPPPDILPGGHLKGTQARSPAPRIPIQLLGPGAQHSRLGFSPRVRPAPGPRLSGSHLHSPTGNALLPDRLIHLGNGSESEEDRSVGSVESQALPSTHRVPDSKVHPVHTKMDVIKKGHARDSQRYKVDYESQSTDTQNFSSESKRETEYGPCRREMEETLNHLKFLNMLSPRGIHIPNCDKRGFYKKKQRTCCFMLVHARFVPLRDDTGPVRNGNALHSGACVSQRALLELRLGGQGQGPSTKKIFCIIFKGPAVLGN